MNEFNISEKIHSLKINKELIRQLENYFVNDVPEILEIDKNIVKEKFSIEITDSFGTEKINSINEFPLETFQDGTKKINLGFSIYDPIPITLKLSFGNDKYNSLLYLYLTTKNARSKSQGLYNGILDRIKPHYTKSYFLHSEWSIMFPMFLGLIIGFPITQFIFSNFFWAILSSLFVLIAFPFFYNLPRFKPYSEFDTIKQKRYNRYFNFIITGIISYLIFTIGFGLIFDKIAIYFK